MSDYQRWIGHAMEPKAFPLTSQDREDMYAPDKHHRGSLTHQLLALLAFLVLREHGRTTKKDEDLMDHLCERIATEAGWDVRVTDLYLQRVAFILAAGRPDLIKPRWIERILDNQQADGGFQNPGMASVQASSKSTRARRPSPLIPPSKASGSCTC